jgi:hypothetical protein
MLRTQAVGVKSLQAAERPADLAPVRFNCWQSTEDLHYYFGTYLSLHYLGPLKG